MAADKILARELALYASNDSTIYRQRLVPFQTNYAKRKAKGTFNKKRAIEGLANNLAKDVQAKYWKENASGRPPVMDKSTKMAFGEEMLDEIEEGIDDIAEDIRTGKRDKLGRVKEEKISGKGLRITPRRPRIQ
jgi:hypothetical protein